MLLFLRTDTACCVSSPYSLVNVALGLAYGPDGLPLPDALCNDTLPDLHASKLTLPQSRQHNISIDHIVI